MNELPIMECPIPISEYPAVTMAHGGGGRLMNSLIDRMMIRAFSNPLLNEKHDGAVFDHPGGKLAYATDSHVITPLFFPGGDIGTLSVYGTVNDLAMCGAMARWMSTGFILEEGLPMETLWRVVLSMAEAAVRTGVSIVTGDTKVVDRGKGDGIYINTSGIGTVLHGVSISPSRVREGDSVVLSGDIGRHGMAIMALREGIRLESPIRSDLAPLHLMVRDLLEAGLEVHCMRDLTRGGLASGLNEIAAGSGLSITMEEDSIPVREDVTGACELLGFDPLYVPNEGRFVVILPPEEAPGAVEILRGHSDGCDSAVIGSVTERSSSGVTMTSVIGSGRIVDMISGEQLPRIC
ncbi:MAG: hydrogenase expression/formation protein HypE [Candidatus Fermentibacteraceae bacterium]|nr:hydrogenase expression/formation protein HypE [Candidatus Fermentibacteraceae bacterium]MBN2608507.1 hydrogenase expression/formation protein HypE [Candidatus Fermentibacteraceae bacterium]